MQQALTARILVKHMTTITHTKNADGSTMLAVWNNAIKCNHFGHLTIVDTAGKALAAKKVVGMYRTIILARRAVLTVLGVHI